jgi:hypothetical protein
LFFIPQLGMCTGMILNLVKTLSEDREEIAASREKSLAASSAVLNRSIPFNDPELPAVVPPQPRASVGPTGGKRAPLPSFPSNDEGGPNGGCYVPEGGGFPFNSRF